MTSPLLTVRDLSVHFPSDAGLVRAVDGVSWEVHAGETLAVVGESGSGKSVTALSVLGLVSPGPRGLLSGSICFDGRELVGANDEELRHVRGNRIAMIFQEPMTSLNPVYTIGDQIQEPLLLHRGLSDEHARRECIRLLDLVGIPAAARRVDEYPHQLSGGMRQRVMIAIALACNPAVLIADEPTTALDVTIQAQILDLLQSLQRELGMAIVLITHDLGVVAEVAHRVVVMYAGKVVEQGSTLGIFSRPEHPYTAGLMQSVPKLRGTATRLEPIFGNVPDPTRFPSGCRFHPRCGFQLPRCSEQLPVLTVRSKSGEAAHASACFFRDENPEADLLSRAGSDPRAQETTTRGEP